MLLLLPGSAAPVVRCGRAPSFFAGLLGGPLAAVRLLLLHALFPASSFVFLAAAACCALSRAVIYLVAAVKGCMSVAPPRAGAAGSGRRRPPPAAKRLIEEADDGWVRVILCVHPVRLPPTRGATHHETTSLTHARRHSAA